MPLKRPKVDFLKDSLIYVHLGFLIIKAAFTRKKKVTVNMGPSFTSNPIDDCKIPANHVFTLIVLLSLVF